MLFGYECNWRNAAMAVCGIAIGAGALALGAHFLAPAFAPTTIWSILAGAREVTEFGAGLGAALVLGGGYMALRNSDNFDRSFSYTRPSLG